MPKMFRIEDNSRPYFVTMTIVDWVDVFVRENQKLAVISSLDYCIKHKGLTIFAYVIMTNHIHMICRGSDEYPLSNTLRDLKKFTSKQIIALIQNEPESRRKWMLDVFKTAGENLKRKQKYQVWQPGNLPKEIFTTAFFYQKLEYIHNNPVKALIVENPEDYLFSSARNYAELDNYLEIEVAGHKPLITNWR